MTPSRAVSCPSNVSALPIDTRRRLLPVVALAGDSIAIRTLRSALQALTELDAPILLSGEAGVGKRACAGALHRGGSRDGSRMQVLGPDSPGLAHFGEVLKNLATTGENHDTQRRPTIYLESVERITLPTQSRIAAALARPHPVRVLASTTTDLAELSRFGRLDRRLYGLLSRVTLHIPPLRDRLGDIAAIGRALEPAITLDAATLTVLADYGWPGNVLELVETLERARMLAPEGRVRATALRGVLGNRPRRFLGFDVMTLGDLERRYLMSVVARFAGNRSRAARHLGISRNTLARKLRDRTSALPPLVAKRARA